MRTLTLVSLLLFASTSAFAQSNPAYRQSGTQAGGPAGGLISSTGGPVAPRKASRIDRNYARSGTQAGGPAGAAISSTGGPVPRHARAARTDRAYAHSGQQAGGPAGLLNR